MARDFPASVGNYLDVGDVAAIDITGTALTLSLWAYPDSSGNGIILAKDGGGTTSLQYRIWYNSGIPGYEFDIGDTSNLDVASGGAIATGVWQHLGLVKNGTGAGALKGYQDGTEVGSVTSNRTIANQSATLRFGGRSADNIFMFDGKIAEVAIWDAALSAAELAALAKGVSPLLIRPANLKGYWPLWGVGSPEADLSGNKNNATITGTVNAANHAPTGPYAPPGLPSTFGGTTVSSAKAGFGIAGTNGYGVSESVFTELGRGIAGTVGAGAKQVTSAGTTSTKAGYAIVGTVGGTSGTGGTGVATYTQGVSVAFGDALLDPFPLWTRIL